MADHGGFDHNYQSYRIVEKLENRFPDFRGLNLTWEVREGILKHETEYDQSNVTDFEPQWQPTVEAQIVNFADEIAYTTADLDDGLRRGLIVPAQLEDIEFWRLVTGELGIDPSQGFDDMDRHRIIRRLVGKEVSDVIQATAEQLSGHNINNVEDVRTLDQKLVTHSPEVNRMNRQLKDFLLENLYTHWRVMRMDMKAKRFIGQLFNAYTASPIILPKTVQEITKRRGLERTVCDYIAGMTDRYALQEYNKLFDPMEAV
jgi:dGTPase